MSVHTRFLAWFAATLAVLAIVPALNYLVILRSGEMTPLPDLVREQQRSGAVYGTGLHDVRGEHPLEIARQRRPEIVVLGSSRALDQRQEFFTRPFTCACGLLDSIDDAETYVEAFLKVVRPQLVLLSLDFWWFTTRQPQRVKPLEP